MEQKRFEGEDFAYFKLAQSNQMQNKVFYVIKIYFQITDEATILIKLEKLKYHSVQLLL